MKKFDGQIHNGYFCIDRQTNPIYFIVLVTLLGKVLKKLWD